MMADSRRRARSKECFPSELRLRFEVGTDARYLAQLCAPEGRCFMGGALEPHAAAPVARTFGLCIFV